jgi:hypothetical protein
MTSPSSLPGGVVTGASSIDYSLNALYSIVYTADSQDAYVVTLSLGTTAVSAVKLTLPLDLISEKWGNETPFHALWIPTQVD